MKPKAFIIVGNANSGTRYLTRLFIANGCVGEDGFTQKLDDGIFPNDKSDIVWKTHMPDDNSFKEAMGRIPKAKRKNKFYGIKPIVDIISICLEKGYAPVIVGVFRDLSLMSYGAYDRGYRVTVENHTVQKDCDKRREEKELQKLYISYYCNFFNAMNAYKNKHKVFIVDYSAMTKNPTLYTRLMSAELSYPLKAIETIDANAKHYKRYGW
jgi:hypothetical protein